MTDASEIRPDAAGGSGFYAGPEHRPFVVGRARRRALLLHGFPGTPAEMRALGEALRSWGWEARAPLLPGFGADIERLGERDRHDWLAAARAAWLELARGAERTVLIGFSMGGALALRLAADGALPAPAPLVLIAPFSGLRDPRAALLPLLKRIRPQLRPFADADFDAPGVRAEFRRISPGVDLDDPEVQERLRREVTLPTAAIDELRRLGREARRAAAEATCPALVLQGRNDTTVAPAATRRLLLRLPGPVAYRELPGGHALTRRGAPGHAELLTALREHLGETAPESQAAEPS